VLLDRGLNGTPGLSNADLTTFAVDAVDSSCFQAKVILDGLKETDDLPRESSTILMMCHVSTLLMQLKIGATKDPKATDVNSSQGVSSVQGE